MSGAAVEVEREGAEVDGVRDSRLGDDVPVAAEVGAATNDCEGEVVVDCTGDKSVDGLYGSGESTFSDT